LGGFQLNLEYRHVDVFTRRPYSGNSLPVFVDAAGLSAQQMLRITQEQRHFEAIFLERKTRSDTVSARIFDLFEELPFAGHPVIGAAAVLHEGESGERCGAYRLSHGLARSGETFVLHQGRLTGRPSTLRVRGDGTAGKIENVSVGGDVAMVGRGILEVRP
jgi:predicted PhzF superfamily epimerase YddE/YHI9